ncbi:hypothetical protein [Sphingomonas glacialis]|uniref:hypothetical protein n=1 Tax=Sphingomonas glacialis TaxID=658225 RepID=UPI001127F081|nr:hypothetical protein [Sphingomonas glacialis]
MKKFKAGASRPIAIMVRTRLAPSRKEIADLLRHSPELARKVDIQQMLAEADVRSASVVSHCPEVRAWLTTNNILHDDAQIEALAKGTDYSVAILSISAPVITTSGDRATFYADDAYGPLAGGTMAVRYRRDVEGRWLYDGESLLSYS